MRKRVCSCQITLKVAFATLGMNQMRYNYMAIGLQLLCHNLTALTRFLLNTISISWYWHETLIHTFRGGIIPHNFVFSSSPSPIECIYLFATTLYITFTSFKNQTQMWSGVPQTSELGLVFVINSIALTPILIRGPCIGLPCRPSGARSTLLQPKPRERAK